MIYRWKGFRFPPHDHKIDVVIVILITLFLCISCGSTAKPHQTKIGYEHSTKDSKNDTETSGYYIEQIFKWEEE